MTDAGDRLIILTILHDAWLRGLPPEANVAGRESPERWANHERPEALRCALNRIVALEAEVKRLEAKPRLDEKKALAFDDLVRCAEHSAVGLVEFQFSRGKFSGKCVLADGDELEAPESNSPEQACHNGYEELRDWYGKREGDY